MSQENYIKDYNVSGITDLYQNQLFYFSGFLFYVDGWSWDNVPDNSNIGKAGVRSALDSYSFDFKNNPYEAISKIKKYSAPALNASLPPADSYNFPELYLMAATCRRFQVFGTWRKKYTDDIYPDFYESYSEDIPSKTPLVAGDLTWSVWAGDIQSFTNSPDGTLEIGNYIFAKKTALQAYTPTSIENSSKNNRIDQGFGEISSKTITNYYNSTITPYLDELSTLKDGWYGTVSLDSTPYILEAGTGINFDTFIKVESNVITAFHSDYPQYNISVYGSKQKQYIDG